MTPDDAVSQIRRLADDTDKPDLLNAIVAVYEYMLPESYSYNLGREMLLVLRAALADQERP